MNPVQAANKIPIYEAYLVRLWQDGPDAPLRASATTVRGGQTLHFATLQALFAFLETRNTITNPVTNPAACQEPTP